MGPVAAVDEYDPRLARHPAGGAAGDPALSLFDLRDGASAPRVLRRAADHGLGIGSGNLRADPAPGYGSRGSGLDRGVYLIAAQLRLLPRLDVARLAAACRLGAALDLCLRRHANGAVHRRLP